MALEVTAQKLFKGRILRQGSCLEEQKRKIRITTMRGYRFALGGIQLGRPQKISLFGPPPPLCTHLHPQRPDPSHLVHPQCQTPPPKKNPPKCMDATIMQFPTFGQ